MLSDVLSVLARARAPERVVIFTASEEAAEMALRYAFEVVAETKVAGHSAAVNQMVAQLSSTASGILCIASDLPKLAPEDIDFVLDYPPEAVTIIHSRDGTGTNGILFLPPARIETEYGPGSFTRHISKASAAGYRAGILNVPGMAFDIDTSEDIRAFMEDPVKSGETWRFMSRIQ
jgi:2-phospho-L-lactate guanylyltransferase